MKYFRTFILRAEKKMVVQGVKIEERIMAVADVFDALISKRCHKSAMPLEME